jgi:DNA (cytosine-5)-methyltransferase 1
MALVDGERMRMLTTAEYRRGMGFPEDYRLPDSKSDAVRMLGNAVPPPLAREVVEQTVGAMA